MTARSFDTVGTTNFNADTSPINTGLKRFNIAAIMQESITAYKYRGRNSNGSYETWVTTYSNGQSRNPSGAALNDVVLVEMWTVTPGI